MATYTPEQIREYTKGMSDKQIAEAAQQFNVSPTQLAGAFNMSREDVTQRAEAAGVPLASTAYEAYQNMQSGGSQDTTMDMLRSSVGLPPQGTGFTPEEYQSYGESLKGMDPFNIKNKVLEDRARLEAQGFTIPSATINQYLDPIYQSSIKEFGGSESTPPLSQLTLDPRTGTETDGGGGTIDTIGLPNIPAPDTAPAIQVPEGYSVAQLTNVLNDVYTSVLGRPLGKEGQQTWINQYTNLVNSGVSPEEASKQIYDAIYNSKEAENFRRFGVSTGLPSKDQRVGGITYGDEPTMTDVIEQRMQDPALPEGGRVEAESIQTDPSQYIGIDSGIGQVATAQQADITSINDTATVGDVEKQEAVTMEAQMSSPAVNAALDMVNPALGSVSEKAQVEAITMSPTSTDVGTIPPAQLAEAQRVQMPQSRTLQSGELVQSAVDAQKAMAFIDQVEAASADPSAKATVQGQLADLMSQFDGGAIPAWAAGAMRNANATLAARGLGASSLAGQAIVQAAMEASLPIAVQDANVQAQFEQQNLSNRQQRAMLAAEQRAAFMQQEFDQDFQARVQNAAKISDIANMNFTAEVQVALENARLAQSVDLANLGNQQAMVMAETAQIAQLELTNLNNRQQAAVQNAQSFLQMDLTNLSNEQQVVMFDAQSRVNALLSDAAAENASRQFNATSENQANQFFQSLSTQVQQFNANQLNTMEQFRVEQENIMKRFNAQLKAQQEQFNAGNQLVVAQADTQWNRQIATIDTAAINMSNQLNAQAIIEMSGQAFANAAQILRDQMDYAFQAGQNDADRELQIVIQKMSQDASKYAADAQEDSAWSTAIGTLAAAVLLP